ncbi:hypothetical protein MMC07_003527 [Pseudocyphellaria aurata]|nr:hypothetical protein [Pseudocyphellaria aurata]
MLPSSLDPVLADVVASDSLDTGIEAAHVPGETTLLTSKFAIYEDSPDHEAKNLLTHSACTMAISSDDESPAAAKKALGKENISPTEGLWAGDSPVARTTGQPRIPLGELDPAEFSLIWEEESAQGEESAPCESEPGMLAVASNV